ncbi:N-acetylmuramoyl-L-alanine amidase [Paenibacillus contaminans]|uniref:Uncharacterized protein n=1 Tax=Paenibacillus contaminans TaxID=450362 RepID=A0A329MFW3_9BACL|nr:N-acetylmuramoyl-L-alanine amidase [Paenibacillus contaminans]RAV18568.1 hypothetical protein DQG23_25030 [Paenibacillus contaminans]
MQTEGIIIHDSACSSINGKGYDFYIAKNGSIVPASSRTDKAYIHICLEGDFARSFSGSVPEVKEQIFLLSKLILRVSRLYDFSYERIFPHSRHCPGKYFPWAELVIWDNDRYH